MAITVTLITEGSSSSNNQVGGYNTAAVTLTGGRLYLLAEVTSKGTSDPGDPASVTCGSATFTQLTSFGWDTTTVPEKRLTVFGCIPASTVTTTAINIALTASTGCAWNVSEVLGFDTSSLANAVPTGKIVTSFSNTNVLTLALTMGALNSANNAVVNYTAHPADEVLAADAAYTLLGTDTSHYNTPVNSVGAEYIIAPSGATLTCTPTWLTTNHAAAIGVEIAVAAVVRPLTNRHVISQAVSRASRW